jgi:hypothetical protein
MGNSNGDSLTTILAILGAVTGTLALAWDVIKWWSSGPKPLVEARSGMLIVGDSRFKSDQTHISITITNRGDSPTTITNIGGREYKSRFAKILRKSDFQFIGIPITAKPLPYKLEPGEVWQGLLEEKSDSRDSPMLLEMYGHFSHRRKPIRSTAIHIRVPKKTISEE